ncbi:MAG: epoxyqueuosine reductase QueH [Saccharofermentanales bacterium]|jgi:predicted adenine nucleotide alpha hydrolase (AANH) superfamily ATPase
MPEKMLLHLCCGPCGEYPIEILKSMEKYDITLYFFNPNIQPEKEWYRRLEGALRLAELRKLPIIVEEGCDPETWCRIGRTPARCAYCYESRLKKIAAYAGENDFDIITTSLLVSPYQNKQLIHQAGQRHAAKNAIEFLAADFTEGYRKGQQMARADGLYRQKYCGCMISLEDSDFLTKIKKDQAEYIIPPELSAALKDNTVIHKVFD